MKIKLAGYNIDTTLIKKLDQDIATPQTITAAYARISRSDKDITELRSESLKEVQNARQSNENIIYGMGHGSIAEHAVFNFDLIGISRLMSQIIHRSRLASYTEKSQRYVTLQGDYVIPQEIVNDSKLLDEYHNLINKQNNLYKKLYEKGIEYLKRTNFNGTKRQLQGKAKEDARYVLPLATQTQMGVTINGRSLQRLLRRLDSSPLIQAKQLRELILNQVQHIAPSLIKYTMSDKFGNTNDLYNVNFLSDDDIINTHTSVNLIDITDEPQKKILKAYLIDQCGLSYGKANSVVETMSMDQFKTAYLKIFEGLKSHHALPRAFQLCDITLQMNMSSACYGQLKRHRMSSIYRSNYDGSSYITPPLLVYFDMYNEIKEVMQLSNELANKLKLIKPGLGDYCLTNAHVVNVLMKLNLRQLYHFVRLRSDKAAQWQIKQLSDQMCKLIKQLLPNASIYLFGKDSFKGDVL